MGKQSRNQNRDRGNAPARNAGGAGQEQAGDASMETQSPGSGMNQEMSRKRRKKFGHN
jgi:hypothetical protein